MSTHQIEDSSGQADGAILEFLDGIGHGVERVASRMGDVAGWLYLACAFYITFDVVSRSLFGFSSVSTVEVSSYLLAIGISWGFAQALATHRHIRVDFLVMGLPVRIRGYLHAVALIGLTLLANLFAWRAWDLVLTSWRFGSVDRSALAVPLVVPQVPFAVGISLFALLTLIMLAKCLLFLVRGQPETVDRMLASRGTEEEAEEALEAAGLSGSLLHAAVSPTPDESSPRETRP